MSPGVKAWAHGEAVIGHGGIWTTTSVASRPALRGEDGSYSLRKFAWYLVPAFGETPVITGRRVDGVGAFRARVNNAYSDGSWWAVSTLYLSTPGCWEITGRYRKSQLSIRVWIPPGSTGGATSPQSAALTPVLTNRALHVPSISMKTPCPVSKSWSQPSRDLGIMLGNGPARPVGLGRHAILAYVAPSADNAYAGSAWGGNKVLWAVAPDVNTDVLVRGRQLDGTGGVRFGETIDPDSELMLRAPIPGERRLARGWRDFPSATRVQHPGCYGYQVDTPTVSTVIVFRER